MAGLTFTTAMDIPRRPSLGGAGGDGGATAVGAPRRVDCRAAANIGNIDMTRPFGITGLSCPFAGKLSEAGKTVHNVGWR